MDKASVETFLAIVEESSLAGAAQALYVSASAVSHRLDTLEEQLGVRLVERSRGIRRVELTVAGRRFLSLAQEWLDLQDRMSGVSTEVGTLKVGIPPSVATYTIRESLQRISNESHLRLKLQLGLVTIDQLRDRQVDVIISTISTMAADVIEDPLLTEEFRVVRGRPEPDGYVAGEDREIRASDLDPLDQIYVAWYGQWRSWHGGLWPTGVYNTDVDSSQMLTTFLTNPQRWSVVPESVARGLEKEGFPVFRLDNPPPQRRLFWAYRRSADEGTLRSIRKLQKIVSDDLSS